jgi:hypothetical protein
MAKIFVAKQSVANAKENRIAEKTFVQGNTGSVEKVKIEVKKISSAKEKLIYGLKQTDVDLANANSKCACEKLGCKREKLSYSIYCLKHSQIAGK